MNQLQTTGIKIAMAAMIGFGGSFSALAQESEKQESKKEDKASQQAKSSEVTATINTSHGDITIKLYHDKAPKTVSNFVTLAQKGFYDKLTFHRIVPGFVIQGGDPKGNGSGGPGYQFDDEFHPDLKHSKKGTNERNFVAVYQVAIGRYYASIFMANVK